MRHLLNPAAAPFALTDLFDQVKVVFALGIVGLACYVVFRAFRGKLGESLGAVAVLFVACLVMGIGFLFQSGGGQAITDRLVHIIGG